MKFQKATIFPALKPYIEQIFVLEAAGKLPQEDLKLILPNGRIKLVLPYRNTITATFNGKLHPSRENKLILVGLSDLPSAVDFEKNEPAGNITIEFSPLGAYRFLNEDLSNIKNHILACDEVLGSSCTELENRLMEEPAIENKINILQKFLLHRLYSQKEDLFFDYCIKSILTNKGKTSIRDLEKETGYSSRWMNAKFNEKIGTSAKNLASIVRFDHFYHLLTNNREQVIQSKEFYNYYYDQSHFIKDFKRFTGYSPLRINYQLNNYDRLFYRD